MDRLSIPDRLEPVAPTEGTPRQTFTSDQRRRGNKNPLTPRTPDEDNDPPPDGETSHSVDEHA